MKNDLNPSIVLYVMNTYYKGYVDRFFEDLYSYGLEALYDADRVYDPSKNTKPFKYFAVCLIRRNMFMFVRDKISKTYQNTIFTDDDRELEILGKSYQNDIQKIDLYRAIATLNDEEKQIIYLLYEKEYTLKKVAEIIECSPKTVVRKHERILNKLKERLK